MSLRTGNLSGKARQPSLSVLSGRRCGFSVIRVSSLAHQGQHQPAEQAGQQRHGPQTESCREPACARQPHSGPGCQALDLAMLRQDRPRRQKGNAER